MLLLKGIIATVLYILYNISVFVFLGLAVLYIIKNIKEIREELK